MVGLWVPTPELEGTSSDGGRGFGCPHHSWRAQAVMVAGALGAHTRVGGHKQ